MNLLDLKKQLKNLNSYIRSVLHDSNYEENGYLVTDNDFESMTTDEFQFYLEYEKILDKLDSVSECLEYLSRPIIHKGELHLTDSHRFICGSREISCGCLIEVLNYDEYYKRSGWIIGRVEYSDSKGGYYLYGHDIPLTEGMTVRLR